MTTKRLKKFVFVGLSVALLLMAFLVTNRKPSNSEANEPKYPIFNDDGTVTLPLNATGYGIRNPETNAIINAGEVIVPVQGKINVSFTIEQNMPKAREYTLIVLVNNEQREYKLNDEKFLSYPFFLEKKAEISLNIEVETHKDTDKEILFVLFEQPSYINSVINSNKDIMAVAAFRNALSCRFFLYADTNERPMLSYSEEAKMVDFESRIRDLYLADDREGLKILAVTDSGQKMDAILSNPNDYEMVYALGSLLDWKQYAFPDGEMIKYIRVPPQSTKVFELTAPVVAQNTPYQVFVVPNGYMIRDDVKLRRETLSLVTSLRTVIVPEGHIQSKKGD